MMKKRTLSILLVVALCLSVMPLGAMADDGAASDEAATITSEDVIVEDVGDDGAESIDAEDIEDAPEAEEAEADPSEEVSDPAEEIVEPAEAETGADAEDPEDGAPMDEEAPVSEEAVDLALADADAFPEGLDFDYDLPGDHTLVQKSGWIHFESTVYGWAESDDGEYYEGYFPITAVVASNDTVHVYQDDGGDYWIDLVEQGTAEVTIYYEDAYGNGAAHTFTVEIVQEKYEFGIWADERIIWSGETTDLYTYYDHCYYDENDYYVEEAEGDFRYEWTIEGVDLFVGDDDSGWSLEPQETYDYVKLEPSEDGTSATLYTSLSDNGDFYHVRISCTVYEGDELIASDELTISVGGINDWQIFVEDIEYSNGTDIMYPGQTITVTPVFAYSKYDEEQGHITEELGLSELSNVESLFPDGVMRVDVEDSGPLTVTVNEEDGSFTITAPEDIDLDEYNEIYMMVYLVGSDDGIVLDFEIPVYLQESYYMLSDAEYEAKSGEDIPLDLTLTYYDLEHSDGKPVQDGELEDLYYDIWFEEAWTESGSSVGWVDIDCDMDSMTIACMLDDEFEDYPVTALLGVSAFNGDDWLADGQILVTIDAPGEMVYYYDLPESQTVVMGSEGVYIPSAIYGWAWSVNDNYYDGDFEVVSVTSEDSTICDPEQMVDGEWWILPVGEGTADITIRYIDAYGEEAEYTFTVEVVQEMYSLDVWTDEGSIFNGESTNVYTGLYYFYYNEEDGLNGWDVDGSGYDYEWTIDSVAKNTFDRQLGWYRESLEDYDDYVSLDSHGDSATLNTEIADGDFYYVTISCTVYDGEDPLASGQIEIEVMNDSGWMLAEELVYFSESEDSSETGNMCPGQTVTVAILFQWSIFDSENGWRVTTEYDLDSIGEIEELFPDGQVYADLDAGPLEGTLNDDGTVTITVPADFDLEAYGEDLYVEVGLRLYNSYGDEQVYVGIPIYVFDHYYVISAASECVTLGVASQMDITFTYYDTDHTAGEVIDTGSFEDLHYGVWVADAWNDNGPVDMDKIMVSYYTDDQGSLFVRCTLDEDYDDGYPVYVSLGMDAWNGDEYLGYVEGLVVFGHVGTYVEATEPTCTEDGNIAYWQCAICGKLFSDAEMTDEITLGDTVIAALGHQVVHIEASEATCTEKGNIECWYCPVCEKYFTDEALTDEIDATDIILPMTGHELIHVEAKDPTATEAGNIEYWYCSVCGKYFSDAEGGSEITLESTVLPATGTGGSAGTNDPDGGSGSTSVSSVMSPQTGDESSIALFAAMLILCLGGMTALVVYIRKRKA